MRILPDLDVYREYISQKKNVELFVSINQRYNIECNEKTVSTHHSTITGVGARFFNKDFVECISCNGISKESLKQLSERRLLASIFPGTRIVQEECGKMKGIDVEVDNQIELSISENICRETWEIYADNCIHKGELLERFMLQCQKDIYLIFTSTGIEGYSVRTVFAPGIKLMGSPSINYALHPEIIITDKEKMKRCVKISDINLPIIPENIKPKYILFSGAAACDLLFFLLMLLTEEMVITGNSYVCSGDIGKRIFSSELTIEENSERNKLIIGTVDGEGCRRMPIKIVENGVLNTLFSGFNNTLHLASTGSAYRFSHTMISQIRPSKVSVVNSNTLQSVLENYDEIIRIDSLTGLTESFSPGTSSFTAYTLATVVRRGQPLFKRSIRVNAQISAIFNEIISIADDEQYGADGSVLSGSFLIENKSFISMM